MIARQLAEFISQTGYDHLAENIVTAAKNCIIDWLGATAAGARHPQAVKAATLIDDHERGAALIGTGKKAAPVMAAFYNGVSAHSVELDDVHRKTMLHPGAVIIAAAWAAAEKNGAGGKELIAAVVLGYEVAIRAAEAVGPSHFKYWDPTGTCGIFGAAAAASKALSLEPEQIVNALGNAGTQAGGLWEFNRTQAMSKQLHTGKAAMGGLMAALLAGEGFTGVDSIFEGQQGFLKAFSRQPRPELLAEGLGEQYKIGETTFKLYPSGRHTHGGIDLALRLRERGIKPREVELLRIKTYRMARELAGKPDPDDPAQAKFSLPFCVATTLVYGHPTVQCFCRERMEEEAVRRLMAHTTVEVDPELDLLYPNYWPTVIEIIDRSSHIVIERTDYPKGDPENPVTAAEIQNKFLGLAAPWFGGERSELLLSRLANLEREENIRALMD